MTYRIYIDYPDSLGSYKFLPEEKFGDEVVSRELGIRVKFICNAIAGISKGDIYEVPFDDHEDAMAFVLKTEYSLVDRGKIEDYKLSKYIYR